MLNKLQIALVAWLSQACLSQEISFQTQAVYLEYNFDWANIDSEIQSAIDNGYTQILIGFYMSLYGCVAACDAWVTLPQDRKNDILSYASANSASVYLAVGGPGESPEYAIQQGQQYISNYGNAAASFAYANQFQGLDFGVHMAGEESKPSVYASNGQMVNYVQTLVSCASADFPGAMSVTGQAPYFSSQFVGGNVDYSLAALGMTKNNATSFYVTQLNLVMFNEDEGYQTYNNIFIQNNGGTDNEKFTDGSAVNEVAAMGVPVNNIKVVKPVSASASAVQTGYIPPATLGGFGCQAYEDIGWNGGFVTWTWSSYDSSSVLNWPSLIGTCTMSSGDGEITDF